jgi:hypothetical protein
MGLEEADDIAFRYDDTDLTRRRRCEGENTNNSRDTNRLTIQ